MCELNRCPMRTMTTCSANGALMMWNGKVQILSRSTILKILTIERGN